MVQALGLMRKTAPFVLFRVIVYYGISAAFILPRGPGPGSDGVSARLAMAISK